MFQTLTDSLLKIFDKIKNKGVLSTNHIDEAMRDIRIALLEADVALPVVKDFIAAVKEKAMGQHVIKSVSPGQMVIKIVHDEMVNILYAADDEVKLQLQSSTLPVNILMIGLQGSGKTTASAKLALKLFAQKQKVLLVSLDTYRPAAREQLETLAKSVNIDSLPIIINEKNPLDITKRAMQVAKSEGYEVVIYDTAGRLHIDNEMMSEVNSIKKIIAPSETLLVVDAMIGQDAIRVAQSFNDALNITGVILSRIDGDARGGAALSIRYITKRPIKFLSSGEHLSKLEVFDAKRIVGRILDMGDIVSFVEHAKQVVDDVTAKKVAIKLQAGRFDFNDYLLQIRNIRKLGGFKNVLSMLPGASKFTAKLEQASFNENLLLQQEAIILSMTPKERKDINLLNGSRKRRIASGAGTSVQQVNILIKQFRQISDLMKQTSKLDSKTIARSNLNKLLS